MPFNACKQIKQSTQHVDKIIASSKFDGRLHDFNVTWVNASVSDCSLVANFLKSTSLGAGLVASKPASLARRRVPHDWTATSQ